MNWIQRLENNKTFYMFLWLAITFLLFINGINSFISSSEFWSIYLSQKIFTFDQGWQAVHLKPVFHLFLSTVYLLKLNDFYHIYAVKILFALNGILQFFIIFKFLNLFRYRLLINLLLTFMIFASPFYISNYDRVRSDQLALTFFLLFLFVSFRPSKFQRYFQGLLLVTIVLIAYKHLYFVLIGLLFIPIKQIYENFLKSKFERKIHLYLLVAAGLIWLVYFMLPAFIYFINSYENFLDGFLNLKFWIRTEWFYVYISIFPFFIPGFRKYLNDNGFYKFIFAQLLIIFFLLIHPQKFNFFIASLTPILYIPSVFFVYYLNEIKALSFKIILPVSILFCAYNLVLAHRSSHFFTFNNPQLIAIDRISNIVTKNRLSYIDGCGILPKARNIGCFVSPNDELANVSCVEAIKTRAADVIIVTNRLMSLNFDFNTLEKFDYVAIGPNFFIRKELAPGFKMAFTDWVPPSLIFSSEQLY